MGPEQCRPLNTNSGCGSFFGPLATGFIIDQLLNGGYRCGGLLYRDPNSQLSDGYGSGCLSRDYRAGETVANRNDGDMAHKPPARAESLTAVVLRRLRRRRAAALNHSSDRRTVHPSNA